MRYFKKGLFGLAVLAALFVPALTAGAQNFGDPGYWETQWEHEARCFEQAHGVVTDDGLAVVLPEWDPNEPFGDHWEGLVVFGGDDHTPYPHPEAGVPYPAPNDAAVTTWIICKGVTPDETTTTTTAPPETTTTAPPETTTTTAAPETTTTTAAPETTTTTAAPETTTSTTAAPAGGVAAGAGGTADSDLSALWLLGGVAALAAVAGAGYVSRRRSES